MFSSTNVLTMRADRLRALVSLYHQSASWLTPENLDAYIDRIFTPKHNSSPSALGRGAYFNELKKEQLENMLKTRNQSPTYGGANSQYKYGIFSQFSTVTEQGDLTTKRRKEMNAALWGVDTSGFPGVDTVKDVLRENTSTKKRRKTTSSW
jgi:hypothetical protein